MPLTNPGPARRGRPRLPWGSILRNLALALVILAGLWLVLNVHLPGPGDLREDIAEGRLVRVLADWCAPFAGYHLYYPSRRQPTPAFALLVDVLRHNG